MTEQKQQAKRIVVCFVGGGTGGHVYPGLAVASALVSRLGHAPLDIWWLGNKHGVENAIITRAVEEGRLPGLRFYSVPAGKLRRYFSLRTITDAFRVLGSYFASRAFLRNIRPSFLFSKGGYVSVPPVWAAASLGIPVFSHESDFDPGLATRLNLKKSKRIFIAYPQTLAFLPEALRERALVSGNPIRAELLEGSPDRLPEFFAQFPAKKQLVLFLGGSLGAQQINKLADNAALQLGQECVIVHQHGQDWTAEAERPGIYYPRIFLGSELVHLIARASLAVARAGAGSVWELAAHRVPMLLVPLVEGSRGDQVRNAKHFEAQGAAVCLMDPEPSALVQQIRAILNDDKRRQAMARAGEAFPLDAAEKIAGVLSAEIAK